jgi:glucose-1-phosphate thymidylyltransferase
MKVIIPTAGRGTRLLPHTLTKPKQLINVAGKAVLGHIIDGLAKLPIEEYIFVVGYLPEQIEGYISEHYGKHDKKRSKKHKMISARFVEQGNPSGQADAILRCREFVDGPVLIVFSDTLTDMDFSELNNSSADAIVYVKEVEDPRRFGIAVLNKQGFVTRFVEKPDSTHNKLAVIGMYYIRDSRLLMECCEELIKRNIQTKDEYYLADAFNLMIKEHGVKFRTQTVDVWEDCGKPETLLQTNRYLLDHGHGNGYDKQPKKYHVVPPVSIAPTAVIEDSIIGPHATIADHCKISGSIIRDSIIDEKAEIIDTMLERSLIGKEAMVRGRCLVLNVGSSSEVDFAET